MKATNRVAFGYHGIDVSRQGVQRDLLPLVEGTTVTTEYGLVKTDHILFIASGAFHLSKPSDLIPELQGRFPIRVELSSLSVTDFEKILTATDACLTATMQRCSPPRGPFASARRYRRIAEMNSRSTKAETWRATLVHGDGELPRSVVQAARRTGEQLR